MSRVRTAIHVSPRPRLSGSTAALPCFHGGAFFEAIGPRFDDLDRRAGVINADVLDAWFDPAPGVIEAIRDRLPWLMRTSPPTRAEGLRAEIAEARGVPPECVVVGAASSDLIFRTLPLWLSRRSRALVLDPTYGEYAHVLEHLVGCRVDRLRLRRDDDFELPADRLRKALKRGYDLVVLVNPNNPTGRFTPRETLEFVLADAPAKTCVWVDEAYVDYTNPDGSLERFASRSRNIVVCKTMSKVYALSGLRVGYLCGAPETIGPLRGLTPPWAVGLPAQVAAVQALKDPAYYAERYRQTHVLREALADAIQNATGGRLATVASETNGLLAFLPEDGPPAAAIVASCRARGLFLRDPGATSPSLGGHALRLAVKDEATNVRMVAIFADAAREAGVID
jgi:histidinol-phosphate/aromatic aminotransferase/cobyric acid decarboxylase-like protein